MAAKNVTKVHIVTHLVVRTQVTVTTTNPDGFPWGSDVQTAVNFNERQLRSRLFGEREDIGADLTSADDSLVTARFEAAEDFVTVEQISAINMGPPKAS